MSKGTTSGAKVRHSLLRGKKVAEALAICDTVCSAGAQCAAVQNSVVAKQALMDLQAAVTAAHSSLTSKLSLAASLVTATKVLADDFDAVKGTLVTYESAVETVAGGNAAIISKSGLLTRDPKAPAAPLSPVKEMTSKPGKLPGEAVVQWPAASGADGYALELNFTPQNPAGPWTQAGTGTRRRRVVKAPAPGAQFLARVAAVDSDGTLAPWSDVLLVTAR